MRILVTNDDGIYSPGISALARIASRFAEVQVVAPDVEQSSMGHAVTHSLVLEPAYTGLFNVNIPPNSKGIKWTRQSVRFYDGKIVPGIDPMGRKHYWFTITPLESAEEGTDRRAVEEGYVSITPLRLD